MIVKLNKVQTLTNIGKRNYNEDYYYPQQEAEQSIPNLYMVCDGVGGSARGEMASKLAVESFVQFFSEHNAKLADKAFMDNALKFVEQQFDDYIATNPESHGMGTTLALLHFGELGITIAHCGDSRVYQLRNGKIIHVTEDHSFVNGLLKAKVITPEEAANHPQRNVITRAIQGSTVKATKLDTYIQYDVQAGDKFFLCSDGILESWSDEALCALFSDRDLNESQIIEKIDKVCAANSNDNYTACLISVASLSELYNADGDFDNVTANKEIGEEQSIDAAEDIEVELLEEEMPEALMSNLEQVIRSKVVQPKDTAVEKIEKTFNIRPLLIGAILSFIVVLAWLSRDNLTKKAHEPRKQKQERVESKIPSIPENKEQPEGYLMSKAKDSVKNDSAEKKVKNTITVQSEDTNSNSDSDFE